MNWQFSILYVFYIMNAHRSHAACLFNCVCFSLSVSSLVCFSLCHASASIISLCVCFFAHTTNSRNNLFSKMKTKQKTKKKNIFFNFPGKLVSSDGFFFFCNLNEPNDISPFWTCALICLLWLSGWHSHNTRTALSNS